MEVILLVVQLLLALALVGVVLIQKSDSDGFGLGSGGGGGMGMFSARGQANFLTRSTAILATLFILNSLVLGIIASNASDRGSLADRLEEAERIKGLDTVNERMLIDSVKEKTQQQPEVEVDTPEATEPAVEAPAAPQAE